MIRRKMLAVLVASAALIACVSTTPRIEYIGPECTLPPIPAIESPEWADLLLPFRYLPDGSDDRAAYDAALDTLEAYDFAMASAFIEAMAMLRALCRP